MDTTTIKGHRLYKAYFHGSGTHLLTCGACLLTSNKLGGVLEESVMWPGNIERRCFICDRMASAKTDEPIPRDRLMMARVMLIRWMNEHTTHPAAMRVNQKLYWIEESLRHRA